MLKKILFLHWKLVLIIFLIGLCLRMVVFVGPHDEGDELIYATLVSQLDSGKGYTLHDSFLMKEGVIDKNQYDRPIFFHPPGGIALLWLFHQFFGMWGFPLVQLFSYALFFWSMMFLATSLKWPSSTNLGLVLVASLSAFSPIMSHVTTKYWLDGPLLGFTTLAVALFIWAVGQNKYKWVFISGILLGYASLIKLTAVLVIPALILIAWILLKPPKLATFIHFVLLLIIPAFIIQIPWEIWQWIQLGTPFPGWAGKPSATLIQSNSYVYYLTVIRSPWVYLTLPPIILWTLIPSCLLFAMLWDNKPMRWMGISLIIWILTVIVFHIAFGYIGYSKVLRYIILVTPASILLFSLLMTEAVNRFRNNKIDSFSEKRSFYIIIAMSVAAYILEIATGMQLSLNFHRDLILPIIGSIK